MTPPQAAIYARVSSENQVEAKTIESQLTALRERIVVDDLSVPEERTFVDEGYSGTTLARPGLEQLRDVAAAGGLDRLYVHSPDRLARKYAYQVLLVEELTNAGVEVMFLNRELKQSPEDELWRPRPRGSSRVRARQIHGTEPTRQASCRQIRLSECLELLRPTPIAMSASKMERITLAMRWCSKKHRLSGKSSNGSVTSV
jgi:hypothetical protein